MTWLMELPALKGARALDVGTGAGHFAHELATRYSEVVGIDSVAAIARATPHPGVTFAAMDAARLDFPDASFDLVAICWALHHLTDPTDVLHEMQRVLKPGGIFLIVEPFLTETGTNQDLHTAAHMLLGEADRLRGKAHFPIFARMQLGSVIQGLKLTDVAFQPLLALPEEADWDLAACQEAAAPWLVKLDEIAQDATFPPALRERATGLLVRLRAEGMRTSPVMRTYGFKVA